MGFIKSTYNFIGFIVTVIIGFTLMGVSYACYISPINHPTLSLVTLVYPIILFINIIVLIFWGVQRNKIVFVPLLFILSTYGSVLLYCPLNISFGSSDTPDDKLSVITYNVKSFDMLAPHTKDNPNSVIECIKGYDADIVTIQEYAVKGLYYNHKVDRTKLLYPEEVDSAFLKIYPYNNKNLHSNQYSYTGLAFFSKYPIVNVVNLFPDKEINGAIVYTLDVNGRELTVINAHLESNKLSPEDRGIYYAITNNIEHSKLFYQDAKDRLLKKYTDAAKVRAEQAKVISNYISNLNSDNIIVCGDFNDTPNSYAYTTIRGDLGDAYYETGFGPGITYNQDRFFFRIDHILYSKSLTPLSTTIDKNKSSDHYPIYAEFAWGE